MIGVKVIKSRPKNARVIVENKVAHFYLDTVYIVLFGIKCRLLIQNVEVCSIVYMVYFYVDEVLTNRVYEQTITGSHKWHNMKKTEIRP